MKGPRPVCMPARVYVCVWVGAIGQIGQSRDGVTLGVACNDVTHSTD